MKRYAFLLLLSTGVAFAACGGNQKSTPTPTSPSNQTTTMTSPGSITTPIDLLDTTPVGLDGVATGANLTRPIVGVVQRLEGNCPAVTFALSGMVKVTVSDKTAFEGGTCADLENGVRVGLVGVKTDNHTLAAARIRIAPPPPDVPPPAAGQVASLTGSCPTLTFVLGGVTVHTTANTEFVGGGCGDVKAGIHAAAAGPRAADNSITAEHVKIGPPPLVAVRGLISALAGTCPRVTFVLSENAAAAGVPVITNDKTRFEGGSCTDLRDGLRAGAMGHRSATGALEAVGVKIAR